MAIIKTIKHENKFALIDKNSIEDNRLSWAATGLLTYLVSRPDNWQIIIEQLKTVKTTGRDATRTALNELRQFGYCHYFEIRKAGKIVENIYIVFETPTQADVAQNYIELAQDEIIVYKTIIEKKSERISNRSTPTVNGFPVNGLTVNGKPATNNIDINNIDINNNHDHDARENELDIFEKLFIEKFKINFTRTNQEAIKKLLKKQSEKEVVDYLEELFANIANTPGVKDIAALFSSKLKKGERQLSASQIKEIAKKEKPTQVTPGTDEFEEIKNKVRERTNYWLDYFIISKDRDKAINSFYADVDRYITEYPELVEEYYNKLIKAMDKI